MITYWWYRHLRYRPEFEKDAQVDPFAVYCMASNVDKIKSKGDKIRERLRTIRSNRLQWNQAREKLAAETHLLKDADFHVVAAKYQQLGTVLLLIALAESGLNYFTAMIAIPAAGALAGTLGGSLRLAAAVIITVIGIFAAEQLFDEVLPSKKYGEEPKDIKKRQQQTKSWLRIILWAVALVLVEFMIYHFGLARVKDIEGSNVNSDTATSIIVLSMIVPIVGGGISWELSNIRDAYKNRKKYDRYTRRIGEADRLIETLLERENGYFQRRTNDYWFTFNRLRSFKEYYNQKNGTPTPPLAPDHEFAKNHDSFYARALSEYTRHKESQDALGRLKLDTHNAGIVGMKIGQDNA